MILYAEIEKIRRVNVEIDIEKHAAHYADERASFDGTDEDFARATLNEVGYDILIEAPFTDSGDGVRADEDYDEVDVNVVGVS